jgi:arsenite-transporting ATPase
VLHHQRPLTVAEEDGRPVLRLALPFATEDDLRLSRAGDALQITVGSWRRNLALPAALRRRSVAGARLTDGVLEVRFTPAPVAAGRL